MTIDERYGLTQAEVGGLLSSVKRCRWNPELGMKMFLKHHPHIAPTPALYGLAISVGRVPFPNIEGIKEGPFPEDKSRPWNDSRLWNSESQKAWDAEVAELERG